MGDGDLSTTRNIWVTTPLAEGVLALESMGGHELLRAPLLKVFLAALLGRLVTIPYNPLSDAMIGSIVKLQLGRVAHRVSDAHGVPFEYDDRFVKLIVSRCTELESGGRMIDAILTNTLLPRVSQEILPRLGEGRPVTRVSITAPTEDFEYKFD